MDRDSHGIDDTNLGGSGKSGGMGVGVVWLLLVAKLWLIIVARRLDVRECQARRQEQQPRLNVPDCPSLTCPCLSGILGGHG